MTQIGSWATASLAEKPPSAVGIKRRRTPRRFPQPTPSSATTRIMRFFLVLALAASAMARTITVFNQCPFTIWYVISFRSIRKHRANALVGPLYVLNCSACSHGVIYDT